MSIVVEDGTGLSNSNSYIDVAYADSYNSMYGNTEWALLDLPDKEMALLQSARALDSKWGSHFKGSIFSNDQSMLFPRYSFYDTNGRLVPAQQIPRSLKDAQSQLAFDNSQGLNLFIDPQSNASNIKSESSSVGNGAVSESYEYFGPNSSSSYQIATTTLRPILKPTAFTGSAIRG